MKTARCLFSGKAFLPSNVGCSLGDTLKGMLHDKAARVTSSGPAEHQELLSAWGEMSPWISITQLCDATGSGSLPHNSVLLLGSESPALLSSRSLSPNSVMQLGSGSPSPGSGVGTR